MPSKNDPKKNDQPNDQDIRAAEQAERDDPTTAAHRHALANGAQELTHDPRPRSTPTPDLYGPQPNPGYAPFPPSGSPLNFHPEQEGWLSELVDAAKAAPESLEALAAVVFELARMVRHDDIASKSKGLPH